MTQKGFMLVSLLALSLLSFWWMKSAADELTSSIVLSATPLQTPKEIIQQLVEESSSSSASGGHKRPSLKEEIEAAKSRLSKSDYKAAKSNYKRMQDHAKKLEQYKQNPYRFDNKGLLKNAPSEEVRNKIIQARIAHLEKEIQAFYNNITKLIH